MIKKLCSFILMISFATFSFACTNLLVGKKASEDGSVMISYNADSYCLYGELYHYPAAVHPKGSMREIHDWDTGKYLGKIPEASSTYNVIGNMNQYQLCITETTFGGRPELVDTTATIDYGSLIYITLQRAKSAREAISVMAELVSKYGYYSEGETFSIADKNEIWMMEMVGKGPKSKGAVWVAVRIPDDCIAAHANQSRIHRFPLHDPSNCLYASDVISFAKKKGYFKGKDADFSFAEAYCPADFGALRFCEARVWSFYNRFCKGMDKYLPYVMGEDAHPGEMLPLYIKPDRKLSVKDVMDRMRDHYEGTPLDPTKDPGAGPYHSPYRMSPLEWKLDSTKYFFERPVSTQQTGFTLVGQMRDYLPDEIGALLWFGVDDAKFTVYTPMYACMDRTPECYRVGNGNFNTFSWTSAFWIHNWVANMAYARYDQMIKDTEPLQNKLESGFIAAQDSVEKKAGQLLRTDEQKAKEYLTSYSLACAQTAFDRWKALGEFLIVKYMDGVVKKEKNGKFERNKNNSDYPVYPDRPQLDKEYLKIIVNATGDKLKMKEVK